ncbi:SDR family NAD(P)-dependent oxidoreductase [Spirillospora sp. CA-253888]
MDEAVVVLTGATGGFGRVLGTALADAGARLVLTGRSLPDAPSSAVTVPADLSDPAGPDRIVAAAVEAYGRIDILINNAGVGGPIGPFWETDDQEWWRALTVNLHGTARMCHAVLPIMIRGGGRVINVVSAAGRGRWPHASAYSVSKAAVIKLGENLAAELRPYAVTVVSYHPGLLDTGMTKAHLDRGDTGEPWTDRIGHWLRAERAAGRFTSIERAAAGVVALASGAGDLRSGDYLTPDDLDVPESRRER